MVRTRRRAVGRGLLRGCYHNLVKNTPVTPASTAPTAQPVPMLDLKRQYRPLHAELLEAVEHVLETQQFILGEPVAAFERAAEERLGVAHAIGCSSGTDALWLAQAAAGIGPGMSVEPSVQVGSFAPSDWLVALVAIGLAIMAVFIFRFFAGEKAE